MPPGRRASRAFCAKTHELVSFLVDVLKVDEGRRALDGAVTYHDSCSGLRELGIQAQPRKLLASVQGLTLKELHDADVCCGFGGTFCVKYPDISNTIVTERPTTSRRPAPTRCSRATSAA